MEETLKKRLIGAVTLVALAVIFVPPLLEQRPHKSVEISAIPPVPDDLQHGFTRDLMRKPVVEPQIPEHMLNPPVDIATEPESTPQPPPEKPELAASNDQNDQQPVANQVAAKSPAGSSPDERPPSARAQSPFEQQSTKTTRPLQAWVIQAASFSQRPNAQKLVKRLRNAGFQVPDLEIVHVQDKTHYRVKVGPMLEKSTAEQSLPKINALSGSKGRVVPHGPANLPTR